MTSCVLTGCANCLFRRTRQHCVTRRGRLWPPYWASLLCAEGARGWLRLRQSERPRPWSPAERPGLRGSRGMVSVRGRSRWSVDVNAACSIHIYYSQGGNVIFFCLYKRWTQWILFLLVMIELTSFRRHFLSLLSNSNKIWPLWNPGNLVCGDTRLKTFEEIWSSFVCFQGAWKKDMVTDEKMYLSRKLCSNSSLVFCGMNACEADMGPSQKNQAGSLTFCLLFWTLWILHIPSKLF